MTANFFPLLGVDPLHGRHFTAEEEAVGGPKVVILSYGLWQRRYGGDPSIVGRSIRSTASIRPSSASCRGTFQLWLPAEAFLITDSQIWKPLQYNYANQPPRNFTLFTVFGAAEAGRHVRAGAGGDGRHRAPAARRASRSSKTATCASASSRCRTTW